MPATPVLNGKDAVMSDPAASYRLQSRLLSKAEVIPTQQLEITISAATAVGGNEFLFFRAIDDDGIGLHLWDYQLSKAERIASEPIRQKTVASETEWSRFRDGSKDLPASRLRHRPQ